MSRQSELYCRCSELLAYALKRSRCIKQLHMVAAKQQLAEPGLQQKVQECPQMLGIGGRDSSSSRSRQAEGTRKQQLQQRKAAASFSGGGG